MTDYEKELSKSEYDFLRENEHLGKNIILLGLGGSHAYGTNTENSDLDVRGVTLNQKKELLTNISFEQFTNDATDTTIYAFNKMIQLLSNCNPNVIEMLGLIPEHYLYVSSIGQELLDNKKMFLSRKALYSFGGYANAQLRRLDNKAMRLVDQERQEMHIFNSIQNARLTFPEKYFYYPEDSINLYIDEAVNPDYNTEIFMDVNLKHYPLRDYRAMWSEMNEIIKSYAKIGKRNSHAIEHGKLGKHMMHLVRLFYMCIDILEKEEINTYRREEHNLLMDIRNGKFLDDNMQPIPEFFEMVDELEKKMNYAAENTSLPDNPDYDRIIDFQASVNERIVKGEIY